MKKSVLLRLLCLLLTISLCFAAFVACGDDEPEVIDTDGDGIPDDKDVEPEDNLDNDNVVNVEDLFS